MKHVKLFEQFVNEARTSKILASVKAALPGVSIVPLGEGDEGPFDYLEVFSIKVPGLDHESPEDGLYLEVYDGAGYDRQTGPRFCFQYTHQGSTTDIEFSAQSRYADAAFTRTWGMPVPVPLTELNKAILDEVVKEVKKIRQNK